MGCITIWYMLKMLIYWEKILCIINKNTEVLFVSNNETELAVNVE